ncbi:hypothetical protein J7L02_03935 [Candidatus Woesearchaeota archaeon]|nr:hypothetical protein [Candidatus Woesearchaeota archaeon]
MQFSSLKTDLNFLNTKCIPSCNKNFSQGLDAIVERFIGCLMCDPSLTELQFKYIQTSDYKGFLIQGFKGFNQQSRQQEYRNRILNQDKLSVNALPYQNFQVLLTYGFVESIGEIAGEIAGASSAKNYFLNADFQFANNFADNVNNSFLDTRSLRLEFSNLKTVLMPYFFSVVERFLRLAMHEGF